MVCSWVEHQQNAARVVRAGLGVGWDGMSGSHGTLLGPEKSGRLHPIEFGWPFGVVGAWWGVVVSGFLSGPAFLGLRHGLLM
jgi:hypothetical protein